MEKMNKLYLILALVTCLSGCNKNENVKTFLEFKINKEFVVNAPIKALSINIVKLVDINNNPYLMCYYFHIDTLYFYSLNKRLQDYKIPLNNYIYSIKDIVFNYLDSIYIHITPLTNYNDSAFVLINRKGEIYQSYGIYHEALLTRNNKELEEKINFLLSDKIPIDSKKKIKFMRLGRGMGKIKENKIYFTTDREYGEFGGYELKLPIFGYFDIKKKKTKFSDLFYPDLNDKYYDYTDYFIDLYERDAIIYASFAYTDLIYKLNYDLNLEQSYRLKSELMQSLTQTLCNNQYEFTYSKLFYNNKHFYRLIYFPDDLVYNEYDIYMIANENLEYEGEAIIKNDGYFYRYSNDTTIVFAKLYDNKLFVRLCTVGELSTISIDSLKIKLNNIMNEQIKKIENEKCQIRIPTTKKNDSYSIFNYLKKMGINNKDAICTIISKYGCPSCNQEIINFIAVNQNVLLKNEGNFYLIYVNSQSSLLENQKKLQSYNFNKNYNHIIIDTTNFYTYLNEKKEFNPRLLVIRDSKIQLDTVFMPSNIENYFLEIVKLLK
ncbi:MAG: hypothetical protein Fur0028_05700 [Bacteroidales bacterium]